MEHDVATTDVFYTDARGSEGQGVGDPYRLGSAFSQRHYGQADRMARHDDTMAVRQRVRIHVGIHVRQHAVVPGHGSLAFCWPRSVVQVGVAVSSTDTRRSCRRRTQHQT